MDRFGIDSSSRRHVGRQPERRRILQLVLGIGLYIVCQLAMTAAAIGVFTATSTATSANVGEILTGDGPAAPVGFLVGAVVAIIGFIVIVRRVSRRPAVELRRDGALSGILWGLLIGGGIVAGAMTILGILGVYRVESVQLGAGILTGLMLGVGPAVMEEVFFRGFLLRLIDGWLGSWAALAIVSVVFALVHSFSSPAGPLAAVFIFCSASLLLNMAYFLTRTLWFPIALHFAFNATQSAIFGLNVSGNETGGSLIEGQLQGSDLLTGAAMGGEGSLIVIAFALAAGVVLTIAAIRRGNMLPRQHAQS
ncbi:lysostaphin resistance A-like protein [Plantibacter sp. RU18]|uniref:CPBP family intramembrane glutamic endopeptidase n=1 Tax=Plantibacter sp. RU18 TaxID=3158143 RepID=UPI003D3677C2